MSIKTLDATGLRCPQPILRAKMALRDLVVGAQLHVISSDPTSVADMQIFVKQTGHKLLESEQRDDGRYYFVIEKT